MHQHFAGFSRIGWDLWGLSPGLAAPRSVVFLAWERLRLGWLHPSGAASAADAGSRLVTLLAVGAGKWIGDRISERLSNSLSVACSWYSTYPFSSRPWAE